MIVKGIVNILNVFLFGVVWKDYVLFLVFNLKWDRVDVFIFYYV